MSTRAAEALHIEVSKLLTAAGIPVLSIKGPATASLLYEDSPREYVDADVLVPPDLFNLTTDVLLRSGFSSWEDGLRAEEKPAHALTFVRDGVNSSVDVHHTFPGLERAGKFVWDVLWERRTHLRLGNEDIAVPDMAATALLIALHAARNGYGTSLSSTDLRRAVTRLDDEVWADAFQLARMLEALEGLVAGLRYLPRGRELSVRFAPDVHVTEAWALHQMTDPSPYQRWSSALTMGPKRRLRFLVGEIFPSRTFMRRNWPVARNGPVGLLAAHLLRWGYLALRVPPVMIEANRMRREWRRARAGDRQKR